MVKVSEGRKLPLFGWKLNNRICKSALLQEDISTVGKFLYRTHKLEQM